MNINYQIVTLTNEKGEFIPDYDLLINNSTCEDEANKWQECKDKNSTFAYNMVYCTQQTCGHWEVFQTPQNEHYPLQNILNRVEKFAGENKCTRCICKF